MTSSRFCLLAASSCANLISLRGSGSVGGAGGGKGGGGGGPSRDPEAGPEAAGALAGRCGGLALGDQASCGQSVTIART